MFTASHCVYFDPDFFAGVCTTAKGTQLIMVDMRDILLILLILLGGGGGYYYGGPAVGGGLGGLLLVILIVWLFFGRRN